MTTPDVALEIFLHMPEEERNHLDQLWAVRNGVPVPVVTLCSGTDAPMVGMHDSAKVLNDRLPDDCLSVEYQQIIGCDKKRSSRVFMSRNSKPEIIFQDIEDVCLADQAHAGVDHPGQRRPNASPQQTKVNKPKQSKRTI